MAKAERIFTQVFATAGAVLEKDGKILLVRENLPRNPDDGKWNQPAGWINVGEDPVAAGKREVDEETGLDFTPTHILGIYSEVRRDIAGEKGTPHGLKILFTGTWKETGRALWGDIRETRWFTPEEIFAMDDAILRNRDIKAAVRHYLAGERYPLSLITHTVME